MHAFIRRRSEIEGFLSNGVSINRPTYIRLMLLASVGVVFTFPSSIILFYLEVFHAGNPVEWKTWNEIHAQLAQVQQIPKSVWNADGWTAFVVYWYQWVNVFTAILFFLFFGLTSEMMTLYRGAGVAIARSLRCIRTKGDAKKSEAVILNRGGENLAEYK